MLPGIHVSLLARSQLCVFQCEYTDGLPYANTGLCFEKTTQILTANVFLSGATPANHTLYESAAGKATGHSFIMARLHCAHVCVHAHITMGLNYA